MFQYMRDTSLAESWAQKQFFLYLITYVPISKILSMKYPYLEGEERAGLMLIANMAKKD
jgi:hypothetical protein